MHVCFSQGMLDKWSVVSGDAQTEQKATISRGNELGEPHTKESSSTCVTFVLTFITSPCLLLYVNSFPDFPALSDCFLCIPSKQDSRKTAYRRRIQTVMYAS